MLKKYSFKQWFHHHIFRRAKIASSIVYWRFIKLRNAIWWQFYHRVYRNIITALSIAYWSLIKVRNFIYWWLYRHVYRKFITALSIIYWRLIEVRNAIYWRFYYSGGAPYWLASIIVGIFIRKLPRDTAGFERFVLVTRGRTGSTAIIDELNKTSQLHVMQELFILGEYAGSPDAQGLDGDYYSSLLPPFDHWKPQICWWQRMIPACCRDVWHAHQYLMYAEKLAQQNGMKIFGWKLLSNHFEERPYLSGLLKKHGYRALYLQRSPASQVLSGLVANQRGIYNSLEAVADQRRYQINLDEFRWHVQLEQECIKRDIALLSKSGFDYIVVSYEDFCDHRETFYSEIFGLFNSPLELPPPSRFKRVITSPRTVIENYDDLVQVAAELGEEL